MGTRLRKTALTVHIITSVGWLGAAAAYVVLDVMAATGDDPATLRAMYTAMGAITTWALVPLAWMALATGVWMSLGTPWGLWRHWWVAISLVLTIIAVAVLMSETRVIAELAAIAGDPTTTDDEVRALPHTLPHSVGGLGVLLVVTALNVVKPRGLTRHGWRKEQERRQAAAQPESG